MHVKNFLVIIDSHLLCDVYDIDATFISVTTRAIDNLITYLFSQSNIYV